MAGANVDEFLTKFQSQKEPIIPYKTYQTIKTMIFSYLIISPILFSIQKQIMGACGGNTKNQKTNSDGLQSKMYDEEKKYLKLMYDDLASRAKQKKLTREVFDTFFHLNGMWGQEMFRTFDRKNEGVINFEEFMASIQLMVRGSKSQRAQLLFNFYDVDKTNGVSYSQLLRMLYSYPKEDLKQMVTDQKFLQTMDPRQLTNFFGPEKQLNDKIIVEQDEDNKQQSEDIARKQSEYCPNSTQFLEIQQKLFKQMQNRRNKKLSLDNLRREHNEEKNRLGGKKQNNGQYKKLIKQGGSLVSFPTYIRSKNMKVTNNVASLVKKYALFIFKELNLDKAKDQIKIDQFLEIVNKQPTILNVYMEGFHLYAWLMEDDGMPMYWKMTPWIEGPSVEVGIKKQKEGRYLRYIRTTLFLFSNKSSKFPLEIKNLEGLIIESVESPEFGFGFLVKHRDGIYPQKCYYFKDRETQQEWLHFMSDFKAQSIYNEYQIVQKIGQGNFSSVYKGIDKASKKQVAIKVIQKFKLSINEKQVLKFECGILELCHHPSVVRFHKKYDTKSNIYIVTELMNEGDLFEYTKKSTFLEEYEAALILKQLIEAIQYLNHELGLIHRDLKPENVLVQTNKEKCQISRVKIIDFGFAVYKSNLKNLPDKEKYAGTPGFVAPQVYLQQDFDEGVDMFSLGIIMFFMLCGHFPFYSPIYEDIRQQTIQCQISFNNAHWMNVSDKAKDLLTKILVYKEHRISSKEALEHPWLQEIDDLKQYQGRNKKNRYI